MSADTFYSPVLIAESNSTTNPPVGFLKIQAKPDGTLYVINSAGLNIPIILSSSYEGVPHYIAESEIHTCPENKQELIASPVRVDGVYRIDGIRIFS